MVQKQNSTKHLPDTKTRGVISNDDGLNPELKKLYGRLTEKQKRFVDAWDGNSTSSAQAAGYKDPRNEGYRCLKNADISRLIRAKRAAELKPEIASRLERQLFWSKTMADPEIPFKYRLKASELLGKSEGDFIERYKDESGPRVIKVGFVDDIGTLDDANVNKLVRVVAGTSPARAN